MGLEMLGPWAAGAQAASTGVWRPRLCLQRSHSPGRCGGVERNRELGMDR